MFLSINAHQGKYLTEEDKVSLVWLEHPHPTGARVLSIAALSHPYFHATGGTWQLLHICTLVGCGAGHATPLSVVGKRRWDPWSTDRVPSPGEPWDHQPIDGHGSDPTGL